MFCKPQVYELQTQVSSQDQQAQSPVTALNVVFRLLNKS